MRRAQQDDWAGNAANGEDILTPEAQLAVSQFENPRR
jgi:hypothetical protein